MALNGSDLSFSPSLAISRNEEKAALTSLNRRFTKYIGNIKSLTDQNEWLEDRIKQLESEESLTGEAGTREIEQISVLQAQLQTAIAERTQSIVKMKRIFKKLEHYQKKIHREVDDRKMAESKSKLLRKDIDHATLIRLRLEGKVELLKEELDVLRKNDYEEFFELAKKMKTFQEVDDAPDPPHFRINSSPSDTLFRVRAVVEELIKKNEKNHRMQNENKISTLLANLKEEKAANAKDKSKIFVTRKEIEAATRERDKLQTTKKVLHHQIESAESRYENELAAYETIAVGLRQELARIKTTVLRQAQRHVKLLDSKLTLECELATYRKLLESEEIRYPNGIRTETHDSKQEDFDKKNHDERSYQMKRHYYSLFAMEMHPEVLDQSCSVTFDDDRNSEEASLDETDLKDSVFLKELVEPQDLILEEYRTSFRSETWSVEAIEVNDEGDYDKDGITTQKSQEVYCQQTLA